MKVIKTIKQRIKEQQEKTPKQKNKEKHDKLKQQIIKKRLEISKIFELKHNGQKITQENLQEIPINKLIKYYKKDLQHWEKII